uniref:Cytosolic endo-beta-N-acetylglucosaminidase n=2 Tax=Denticeps clupeoides TaxID=299321 RepID=A0AAY4AVR5_9TELE
MGGKKHECDSGFQSNVDDPTDLTSEQHETVQFGPSTLPAKHYDPDTTEPISSNLQSLDELLSWKRSEASPFNVATVPLANRQPSYAASQKRTLVCHDMMGGYLDDRFIQGAEVETPYAFYHWDYIDIFNYFSHNMVTIPPVCWTNTAHKHGVLSLGTFITEWTDGAKMCEKFLADKESYCAVADKLVEMSDCYGFDGWLINIENVLSETAVKNMPPFLHYLTDCMHKRVTGSVVIWYDSVLQDGKLKWQNELNDHNRVFFEACDGLFTNYNWTESSLEFMKVYSAAQGRLADVFVGVDVFARGEVVAGKFETNKALSLIRKHGFSTALFAPGWVYECHDKTAFRMNQDKFWGLLSEHLFIHRPFFLLPVVSSFCLGFGKNLFQKGQVIMERNWFNLNAQELQPHYYTETLENQGWIRTQGCPEDAWSGGSSLLIEGVIPSTLSKVCARIFSLHVPLATRTFVSFIYKVSDGVSLSLELKLADAALCTHSNTEDVNSSSVVPDALGEEHQLVKQFTSSCGEWVQDSWIKRCFQLELSGCALRDICVNVTRDGGEQATPFKCRIGEIMVLDAESLLVSPVSVQSVHVDDIVWQKAVGSDSGNIMKLHLNATIKWCYPAQLIRHFCIHWRRLRGPDPRVPPGQLALVGRSYSNLFRVVDLVVPDAPALIELAVEPVTREGFRVPEANWGRHVISYIEGDHSVGAE